VQRNAQFHDLAWPQIYFTPLKAHQPNPCYKNDVGLSLGNAEVTTKFIICLRLPISD